jgi:hypothetical protein
MGYKVNTGHYNWTEKEKLRNTSGAIRVAQITLSNGLERNTISKQLTSNFYQNFKYSKTTFYPSFEVSLNN